MTDASDLAILGGPPAFDRPLHVGRPNVGDRAAISAQLEGILDRVWLSNDGPCLREFEERLAAYLGVRHAIVLVNGTVALQVMAKAAGMDREVIMPSFTFVATAHGLAWQGVTPVFCDVDPETHNMDPAEVESLITERTSGILGVHVWGRPCAVGALQDIADRHGIPLAFDAAHAMGASHRGRMIGGFGMAEAFSFHATKFFNTFEGGAITTDDDEFARRCRLMRNFGFAGPDNVVSPGVNGKMTEICAAMGLVNLDSIDRFIAVNERNHRAYEEGLAGIPGVRLATFPRGERCNYQYVVVEVDASHAGLSRDVLHAALTAENVLARRYFYPGCHMMEPYRSAPGWRALPRTEALADRVLSLPNGTAVGPEEIATICAIVRRAVVDAETVAAAWERSR